MTSTIRVPIELQGYADMTKRSEIILPDSPEAATRVTIDGWQSRDGFFYPSTFVDAERRARESGATHRPCLSCGAIVDKRSYCEQCEAKTEHERYLQLPEKRLSDVGVADCLMIFANDGDGYVNDLPGLIDYCKTHKVSPRQLDIAIARPNEVPEVDVDDYFADYLPEGVEEVPRELEEAFAKLNSAIREFNANAAISYGPQGSFRVTLSDDDVANIERESGLLRQLA